jgi:hypothetical protein
LNIIIVNNDVTFIALYMDIGIFPNQEDINYATENNLPLISARLAKYEYFPEQKSINIAYEKGYFGILNVLKRVNLHPTVNIT